MPKPRSNENDVGAMSQLESSILFDVREKVVIVTGGGSGIGAMISMTFVQNGAKVYIVSRKDTSDFASQMQAKGTGKCISISADLGSDEGVQAFASEMERREPNGVHVLVNNSGTNWAAELANYEPKHWDKVYNLNVKGVFNLTRLLVPLLEKAAEGCGVPSRVINISSIDSLQVTALETYAYSSGKAAVSHMSRVLAGHLGRRNITVNSVCPGPFPSRMMRATIENAGEEGIARQTVLGRLGRPGDMGGVCLYLASDAGSYVTGASIVVDGGALIRPKL